MLFFKIIFALFIVGLFLLVVVALLFAAGNNSEYNAEFENEVDHKKHKDF